MPKVIYKQNFRDAWMQNSEFKDWLRKVPEDATKAYCFVCKCLISAKLFDIRQHASTKKHIAIIGSVSQKNKINFVAKAFKTEEQEASLCLYIAEHTAIAPIDHLSQLCAKKFASAGIKLGRTKCTHIIKNVLAVHFAEDLRLDIGDSKYSLLLDESTDISVTKLLGVVINYYSNKKESMVSTFLGLIHIESGDAISIADCVKMKISKLNLDISNMVGLGTDNANVMTGSKKSVYTELKRSVPSLVLIKCVCHSIQLAVNQSCKSILPEELEFLISDTYSWFAKSSQRQTIYKKMYESINNDQAPLKIPRVCDTRWLSIEPAVSRIQHQWSELKQHFYQASKEEKCHKAKILHDLYCDDVNLLYLLFLKPVLSDMQRLNKIFQSERAESSKLLDELITTIDSLKNKIIPPNIEIDILKDNIDDFVSTDLYLGYAFEQAIKKPIYLQKEPQIRKRCTNFIKELILQLRQRLPDNFEILRKINVFAVENILRAQKNKTDFSSILEFFKSPNTENIMSQLDKIHLINWHNTDNSNLFWSEVLAYKDAGNNRPFEAIASFAIELLCLPWSNAEIERVFSQVNLIKTKLRNQLHVNTLNAILTIRYGLRRHGKCCHEYDLPNSYLELISTNDKYGNNSEANLEEVDDILNLSIL